MADLEESLLSFLIALAGVKTVFGTPARIYVDRIDPKTTPEYPFAIIRTVQEAPEYAHDGALKDRGIYQIDVYSTSKTTANSGTAAIRTELTGYSGTMGSVTAGSSFIINTRGGWDPDGRVFRRSTDVQIGQTG